MKRQRKLTQAQLTERIRSIAEYTVYARENWGTESGGYIMQVEILKDLAVRNRELFPNPRRTK